MPDKQDHSQDREPVGSVAEETARLLEALGGWAQGAAGNGQQRGAAADGQAPQDPAPATPTASARCEHCGVDSRMGEALTCRLCPICQGISLIRAVRPETVDRLADLAAFLSGTLRDLAAESRGGHSAHHAPAGEHRVQDISVEDGDGTAETTRTAP